ncbi:MAG: M20/M25/M40 family metallo-hydrolase [Ignavibacterium sp.]
MRISWIVVGSMLLAGTLNAQPPRKDPTVETLVSRVSSSQLRQYVETLAGFGTRHSLSDTVSTTRGIGAARRWIKSEFDRSAGKSGGRMSVAFHETVVPPSGRVRVPTNIVNVVATLSGTSAPERMIVVGGHYDSRASDPLDAVSDAPGANDDGSGTALVLELARVMADQKFDATIVFIAFAGEEQGLLGATAWADQARDRGWNVEAMLNNDIVGSSVGGDGVKDDRSVRLFSEAFSPLDTGSVFRMRNSLGLESDGSSRSLARWIDDVAGRYVHGFDVRLIHRRDRFLRGGDHSPFHARGIPAVRFSVARENYDWQHQNVRVENGREYGDLVKFMDFEYLANVARVNAAALATLALAPAAPRNAGVVVSRLEYETTLRWNANTEPDLAGYYVRVRETTSPVWQEEVFTRDTIITIPKLKDDYLFGVQAVDKGGVRSLMAIPVPVR